jgi:adenosylmethionine-8-amino-7-oxononanoate aminotransferase
VSPPPDSERDSERDSGPAADWRELDRRFVWHPYTQMQTAPPPLPVVGGHGAYLELADGRRLLDGISSWWVNIHGHCHPRLNRALARQAERLVQVIFAGFSHEPASRLAAELVARAPRGLTRVFYSDDGSTAVEVALKMAYQAWRNRGEHRRNLFVAFDRAYHGDTFGAMAAGGIGLFHREFADLFCQVRRARGPYAGSYAGAPEPEATPPTLSQLLEREGERVAAVILEPMVQAAGGMIVQPPEFLRQVRALTREHGIPLIADEVFTGFGRTGPLFACAHGPIEPDLMCLSKGLTAGYLPLSATLASEEIYQAFLSADRGRTFFHGHSFTGNALSCAVALESLAMLDEGGLARVGQLEALFTERLARLSGHPRVADTRGLGALAAIELAPRDLTDSGGYLDTVGPWLYQQFLDRGLLLRPLGNVLYFLPPYVVTEDECHRVFDAIEEVLERLP